MIKNYMLYFLMLIIVAQGFANNGFRLIELNTETTKATTSKIENPIFRYENKDFIVIQSSQNSASLIQNKNIDIQSYLGNGYYLVSTDINKIPTSDYNKIGYIEPLSKINIDFQNEQNPIEALISVAPIVSKNSIQKMCDAIGVTLQNFNQNTNHFIVNANHEQIIKIAEYPFVIGVSAYYRKKKYINGRWIIYA